MALTLKEKLFDYISENYQDNQPIIQKDMDGLKGTLNPVTLRQNLLRLSQEEKIIKSSYFPGVYHLPASRNTPLDTLENIYIYKANTRIGYESGLNLANKLGLTSQTSPFVIYVSNQISELKKTITIGRRKFIIQKARASVNDENYKLLQVCDMISDLEYYSELNDLKSIEILKRYLGQVAKEVKFDELVSSYPLKVQLYFYKKGLDHVFTS
jgi:hypothetical protein